MTSSGQDLQEPFGHQTPWHGRTDSWERNLGWNAFEILPWTVFTKHNCLALSGLVGAGKFLGYFFWKYSAFSADKLTFGHIDGDDRDSSRLAGKSKYLQSSPTFYLRWSAQPTHYALSLYSVPRTMQIFCQIKITNETHFCPWNVFKEGKTIFFQVGRIIFVETGMYLLECRT